MINFKTIIFLSVTLISAHAVSTYSMDAPKNIKSQKLCLGIRKQCLTSKYPCCPLNYKGGIIGPTPLICFKFGKGVCQEYGSIKKPKKYNQLLQQLNGTNFQELKKKYWDSVLGHEIHKASEFIPRVIQI